MDCGKQKRKSKKCEKPSVESILNNIEQKNYAFNNKD
jgi:hypothetical protein